MTRKNVYVEQRPQGDFAVRKAGSGRASAIAPTQAKAIERAREISPGVAPDVERVRHTNRGMSPIGIKEPGMIGVMEPVLGS